MKKYFLKICLALWVALGSEAIAQTDISMATHWYNRANYNPASITKTEYIYLFSNTRSQWDGVNGAPKTLNVQVSEYIHSLRSAFGISLVSDRTGISRALNPMLTYAWRLANDRDWSFSMGLSVGVFTRFIDGSLYEAENTNDPALYYDMETLIHPDANVGFELQSPYFIVGLSSTHLFSITKPTDLYLNANHRYGYAIFKNTDSEVLNYSLGLQVVNRYQFTTFEGNATLRFKHATGLTPGPRELFDIGCSYRSTRQLSLLLGLNISPLFRVGYAYDKSFMPGYTQNPSHEIMLEYRIPSGAASTCIQCRNMDYWYF